MKISLKINGRQYGKELTPEELAATYRLAQALLEGPVVQESPDAVAVLKFIVRAVDASEGR